MQTRTKKAERVPELFKALAEPQRIAIVRLVHEQELPAGEIANHFGTTRQAISQHLRLMTNAGLLEARCVGTKRLYKIRQDAFRELRSFLEVFWGNHLSAFKQRVELDKKGGR
jgi:DNA-binding transcriptional ArsR family regulator